MIAKKTQLLTIVAALLIPLGVQANDTPVELEFQQVFPVRNPIVLDGDISDEEWGHANVIQDPQFFIPKGSGNAGTPVVHEELSGTWSGEGDQSSFTRFLYDFENLYVSHLVVDDFHENGANSPWNGDSAQIMIANEDRDAQIGLYNFALNGREDDANFLPLCGPIADACNVMHEAGPSSVDEIDAAIVRGDGFTNYEIRISAAALDTEESLEAGFQIGFGVAINDGDDDVGGQGGWVGLGAHSIVFGKTPQETVVLVFDNDILPPDLPCDFNVDDLCDVLDIDLLGKEIIAGTNNADFDMNGDGVVNLADQDQWRSDAATENGFSQPYLPGDADLDGSVVVGDLNIVGTNWQQSPDPWGSGDFNVDGMVNVADLNLLAVNWQQSIPAAAAAVPEPMSLALVIAGLLGLFVVRRR